MERFSVIFFLLFSAMAAQAREIDNVTIPETLTIDGKNSRWF